MTADGLDGGGPSEAELQQMLALMREAPAEQVLVEVVNVLLQAVQVKLGRPDARVLLDAVAAVADAVRGRADAQFTEQVTGAVAQLRLAQVEAEGVAAPAVDGSGTASGSAPGSVQGPGRGAPTATSPRPEPSGGSRLWTPGR
jgi:hypothetical protein